MKTRLLTSRFSAIDKVSIARWLSGDVTRRAIFVVLAALVFALGGASRGDALSLILLRPLSVLACGYALLVRNRDSLDWPILFLLLALAATAILQLIPLPPSLWQALPGRQLIADIDAALGFQGNWRPLTLSPSKTANTLFSLGVPIAAVLWFAVLPADREELVLRTLLAAGLASALLGILQILGPPNGPLYTYRITNGEAPVGLFANRNHNAIFLASTIPLASFLSLRAMLERTRRNSPYHLMAIAWVSIVVPLILIGDSRAGAAAAFLASTASLALWLVLFRRRGAFPGQPWRSGRVALVALLALAALGAVIFMTLASRSALLERVFNTSLSAETRSQLIPVLWQMAKTYFPVGSGFGAFEPAYKMHEPHALLSVSYLNQAHNDLMQFVIEAGVPGIMILAAGLGWFFWSGIGAWRQAFVGARDETAALLPLFAWVSLATILGASLVDYPLRTPAIMLTAVLLACIVNNGTWRVRSATRK